MEELSGEEISSRLEKSCDILCEKLEISLKFLINGINKLD